MTLHHKHKIVILAGDIPSTPMVVRALQKKHTVLRVVVEGGVPRATFLRRRMARIGAVNTLGQVAFMLCVVPVLAILARRRKREIRAHYDLETTPLTDERVVRVDSVNSEEVIALLLQEQPDVVVVHGTRIVSARVLSSLSVPYINIHAGMTPMYRGVHGGYWALASGHPEYFGVTVHLMDPGIDTGGVLAQTVCPHTPQDSYVTYPLIQLGEGLRLLADVLDRATFAPLEVPAPFSRLWYHPTLWGYLSMWIKKGVR